MPDFESPLGKPSAGTPGSKPTVPEEAVQVAADELEEAFKNVRFRFWTCINKAHRYVTWNGDVASCDTCGLTSEMTRKRDVLVRADERCKVADQIAAEIDAAGEKDKEFHYRAAMRRAAYIARQIGEARA